MLLDPFITGGNVSQWPRAHVTSNGLLPAVGRSQIQVRLLRAAATAAWCAHMSRGAADVRTQHTAPSVVLGTAVAAIARAARAVAKMPLPLRASERRGLAVSADARDRRAFGRNGRH